MWFIQSLSNTVLNNLTKMVCYLHSPCLHVLALSILRQLPFCTCWHCFFVPLIEFHSILVSCKMKSLVLFPSMNSLTYWSLSLLSIPSQSHHMFVWTNCILSIMVTSVSLSLMKTLNGLKSLLFLTYTFLEQVFVLRLCSSILTTTQVSLSF